jgi:membrane fusion protein (multidrug efflux system)
MISMTRYSRYRVFLACALALLAGVSGSPTTTVAQAPGAAPPAVLVVEATRQPLAVETEFIGRVEAIEKVEIRARVQGFLVKTHFEAGASVEKDQLLFTIEREPFEATLAQRKAQLAGAEATLQNATATLRRYRTLESKQVASEAQLDISVAEEARARASVLEAQAGVTNAEIQLSYTEIRSPIAGRIGRAAVTPGNLVGPDSGVLTTVVRTDEMYALFPVTQSQLLAARRRMQDKPLTVSARLSDGSLLPTQGKIDFLDVVVDPRTDGQLVRAVFPNPDKDLTDGMTLRVAVVEGAPEEFTVIPLAAVATDQAGRFAFVVNDQNVVEQRRLGLGLQRDGLVAVREGLKPGERVIVQGQQRVRPGTKVNAQPMPVAKEAGQGAAP